jgi:hypothetical protein
VGFLADRKSYFKYGWNINRIGIKSGFSYRNIPLLIEDIVKKIVYLFNNMNFHPNFAIIGQKVNI